MQLCITGPKPGKRGRQKDAYFQFLALAHFYLILGKISLCPCFAFYGRQVASLIVILTIYFYLLIVGVCSRQTITGHLTGEFEWKNWLKGIFLVIQMRYLSGQNGIHSLYISFSCSKVGSKAFRVCCIVAV